MPRWKENHYTRAADFARLLGSALGRSAAAPDAAVPAPAAAPAPAAPAASPAAAKPAAAPGPSAASVFTAIPWKK